MNSKKIINFTLILFIIFLNVVSIQLFSQTHQPSSERMEADALALAYIDCEHALTNHYFQLNQDDKDLKNLLNEQTIAKKNTTLNTRVRYSKDDDLMRKFEREYKSAKKQLNKCIKYQGILDAKAEEEKQKAKLSE